MNWVIGFVGALGLATAVAGCTTTQEAVGGAVGGGTAGLFVAGPIGAAVGAGAGAIATPMIAAHDG